jgi:hypothetical protein
MYKRTHVAVAPPSSAKRRMWRLFPGISYSPQGNMKRELEEQKKDTITVPMCGLKTKKRECKRRYVLCTEVCAAFNILQLSDCPEVDQKLNIV